MIEAIKKATNKPVTLKHRIGIDVKDILPEHFERTLFDKYEDMLNFIKTVDRSGVDRYIIHARIAILAGLSPKENREVPPLRYEEVYRLKEEFPGLNIVLNGGIKTIEDIEMHLKHVDGVMIGRAAYDNPFLLTYMDSFSEDGEINKITRKQIIERMIEYVDGLEKEGIGAHYFLRHTLGLFHEKMGSRTWKQLITPPWPKGYSGRDILYKALEELPEDVLNEVPQYKE
jgi:tRNA-dihydrouridine synthase A